MRKSLKPPSHELLPNQLAASFAQEEGDFLYFDSSGHLPHSPGMPLSILAAQPTQVLRGHLSEGAELRETLQNGALLAQNEPYPTGGLAGWVDYEGNYTFGVFPRFMVYGHDRDEWLIPPPQREGLPRLPPRKFPQVSEWTAEWTRSQFEAAVRRSQAEIAKGKVYQVNLSQRFTAQLSAEGHCFSLYEALRKASPAPMSGYARFARQELMCSSPERFLKMSGREVETRPIKGTRPRYEDQAQDQRSACALQSSEKELSELVMITDLLRNDLGQVCQYGSVRVEELLSLEKLEQVFHLVSTVKGELRPDLTHLDVLQQCYPGGSITGAPKHTAMQLIAREEPTARGLYTGVMGYLGFNGESQFNILIRTLVRDAATLQYRVGAGIVADSDPASEYEETLLKAEGMRRALKAAAQK